MGSSAQKSSGVHWCSRLVRFNELPENVWEAFGAEPGQFNRVPEKFPEKGGEALVQSQVRFNRVPEKVPKKVGEASVQSRVRFNRVPEKVLVKVWGCFGAEGSGEGSGEGLGGFGAETCRARSGWTGFRRRFQEALVQSQVRFNRVPGKVPEKVPEKVWEASVQSEVRFNRVPEKVLVKVWEALVQSQVRFNRVPEKVPEKVWEALQSQVRFNRVPEKVPEKVWEALVQSQVRFNRFCGHLIHGNPAEVFPVLGFAASFRKICKNTTLRLLGIPPKLIYLCLRFLFQKILWTHHFPSDKNMAGLQRLRPTCSVQVWSFFHIFGSDISTNTELWIRI